MNLLRARAVCAVALSMSFLAFCSGGRALPEGKLIRGRSESPASDWGARKFSSAQLQEDFAIARQALEEGHIGIYRYTPKPELDRVFDGAAKSIDRPMSARQFYRLLAPTVAALKCGHTRTELPDVLRQELNSRVLLLPTRVRLLGGKVYVFRDFSNDAGRLAGQEIRSINGLPAKQLVEEMMAATPADGDVQTSRQLHLSGWRFAEHLVALTGLNSPYRLRVWDGQSNREEEVVVEGLELTKLREAWRAKYPQDQPPERVAELKHYGDGAVARLTIRNFEGFADERRQKKLEDFLREAFEEIQSRRTKALIIDLRDNGGGYDHLGALLLSYLLDKPFKHYEDIVMNDRTFRFLRYAVAGATILESFLEKKPDGKYHLTGHPTWGLQHPSKPTFNGKVFVLMNGRSFSTTSEFIAQAHFHRRATFIGEEAGGGYYGNTAGFMPVLELPNTKLRLAVPLTAYHLAVSGYPHSARGLIPDHPITYTVEELLAGQDKELDLALRLAGGER